MNRIYFLFLFLIFLCSCENRKEIKVKSTKQVVEIKGINKDSLEKVYKNEFDLVNVIKLNSNIFSDIKYASDDNFMNQKLYEKISAPFLKKDVARRLSKCQEYLTSINSKYHLLIYDAVRPVETQWKMWNALDTVPFQTKIKFVSNPKNGSVHNYGAAVDITICDENKNPLDMGAGYDDIDSIAHPSFELYFLNQGLLNLKQINNRKLLRKVMQSQGFINIPSEWWHFNACPRRIAKEKYTILEKE